jgi:ComF family protein
MPTRNPLVSAGTHLGGMSLVTGLRIAVGSVADRALDLALPPTCAGCNREGSLLCRECRPALDVRLKAVPGVPVGLPADLPAPLLQLEWCAPFTGVTRRAVHRLKYSGERRLAGPLGQAIANRWRVAGAGGDVLVPVPASADRIRERGYDQAVLIARVAGRHLQLPVVEAVRRAHDTMAQFDLDRADRGANVRDAFDVVAADQIRGRWVVLVDDIVTTGATLAACAEALLREGATAVSAVTVARER